MKIMNNINKTKRSYIASFLIDSSIKNVLISAILPQITSMSKEEFLNYTKSLMKERKSIKNSLNSFNFLHTHKMIHPKQVF